MSDVDPTPPAPGESAPPPRALGPAPVTRSYSEPTTDPVIPSKAFPLGLGALFAVGMLAPFVMDRVSASPPPPAAASAPAPAPAPTATPVEAPAPTATSAGVTADEFKALKGEVEALAKSVAEMPKPAPAPDLAPVQEKLDGLAKTVEGTAELPKKLDDVSAKLAENDKTIASLKDELAAAKAEVTALKEASKSASTTPSTTTTTTITPNPAPTPDAAKPAGVDMAAMNSAVDLFKANKFADALAAFQKLPADDARVLYYSALARGFSAGWTGETVDLVNKGIALEKAGSPPKADIDAAFSGLTKAQGKDWLDGYRARAK